MRDEREREWDESRERGGNNKAVVFGVLGVLVLVAVASAAWYFLASGETTANVIADHQSRFTDLRAKMKRIGEKLPPAGSTCPPLKALQKIPRSTERTMSNRLSSPAAR